MKTIFAMIAAAAIVSGCEAARMIAPQTTAGFETGGVLGALDGASGAILAKCRTLDGVEVRVAVDSVAALAGEVSDRVNLDLVDRVRAAREKACLTASQVNAIFADDVAVPIEPPAEDAAAAPATSPVPADADRD